MLSPHHPFPFVVVVVVVVSTIGKKNYGAEEGFVGDENEVDVGVDFYAGVPVTVAPHPAPLVQRPLHGDPECGKEVGGAANGHFH